MMKALRMALHLCKRSCAPEAIGDSLGVAMLATLRDLGAPRDGVPSPLGPFNRRDSRHLRAMLSEQLSLGRLIGHGIPELAGERVTREKHESVKGRASGIYDKRDRVGDLKTMLLE